jgi:hypothetical protein
MLGTLKKWNVFMRNINPFLKNSCQEWWSKEKPYKNA